MSDPLQASLDGNGRERGGWWLRLTAPPGARQYDLAPTHRQREHLRRSQLTSWTAPFVFLAPLLLLQQAGNDFGTTIAIVVLMSTALLALVLNRLGRQVAAALLLVLAMDVVIEGALITAPGGLGSGWLLSFDLFIIPLIAVGVLLDRRFLWGFMFLHICCILGDFYLLPHALDLNALIEQWHGPAIAFARPVIIQIGGGLLSFIEVKSTDEAIARADRAQLLAALQQSIAEEKQQLEKGIREIMDVLARAANGQFTVRATLSQEHVLWQVNSALNTLFSRLQSSRQAEVVLRQTEREIVRLREALRATLQGQSAVWPLPSGGPLDPLIREMRTAVGLSPSSSAAEANFSPRTPGQAPPYGGKEAGRP